MSEEQGFLQHLAANPGDDLTRSVYADWLEERGDARSAYLRAEMALAEMDEAHPQFAASEQELAELGGTISPDWVEAAGKRWDVWLTGYTPTMKISVIKSLRELTGCGLADAKTLVESAPTRILDSCSRVYAEAIRSPLGAFRPEQPHETQPLFIQIALRPSPDPTIIPRIGSQPVVALTLLEPRVGQTKALIGRLAWLLSGGNVQARAIVEAGTPTRIGRYPLARAQTLADGLREFAVVKVQSLDAPFSGCDLSVRFRLVDVRLVSYPRERKIAVIQAYRKFSDVGLLAAKAWSEGTPPLVIVRAVDAFTADRVRHTFAEFGEVIITEATSA